MHRLLAVLVAALWGAVVVAAATWLVRPADAPRPRIHGKPFQVTKEGGMLVQPQRSREIPLRFGDFDLHCRVVLSAGAELDLVFRKVEHWGDVDLPLFHARFGVLRMSSVAEGPGFLEREDALFAKAKGGILVGPGEPGASLTIECRGRRVRANINGIELPELTVPDDFGNAALLVRGGTARVHDLQFTPWPRPQPMSPLWMAAAVGGVAGLLVGLLGSGWIAIALSLATALLGAVFGQAAMLGELLRGVQADPLAVLLVGVSGVPLALCCGLALRARTKILLALVVGMGGAVALIEVAVRVELDRYMVFEDDRMEATFGPESGTAPFDALSRMLRCEFASHPQLEERYDVLLLGGKTFFDPDDPANVENNLTATLPGSLRTALKLPRKERIEVAAIPTVLGHANQQLRMFDLYYRDFRPRVVVLGLTDEEVAGFYSVPGAELEDGRSVREQARAGWATLALWRRAKRERDQVQQVADLQKTLGNLAFACKSVGARLVLAIDASLPAELVKTVDAFAKVESTPVVRGFDVMSGKYASRELVRVIAPLLGR